MGQDDGSMTAADAREGIRHLLNHIGEDPMREGLLNTPARVVRAYEEMTAGYNEDPAKILSTTFDVQHDQMIVCSPIEFTSLCEHHLLPFQGVASVGYLPGSRIVGLSKLARIVLCYARRLQVQERMTEQIAQAINEHLQVRGVGVLLQAHHCCMGCRGVKQKNALMTTSALIGDFSLPQVKSEFFTLIKR